MAKQGGQVIVFCKMVTIHNMLFMYFRLKNWHLELPGELFVFKYECVLEVSFEDVDKLQTMKCKVAPFSYDGGKCS